MQEMNVSWGRHMNAIDIQARRSLVFKYWCLELTPQETFTFINPKYSTSVETIRRDLRNMSEWLPQLTSLEEGEIDESIFRIMGQMRMAQKRVTSLMFSNNDSVAVGASKALHAMVSTEAALRMDLGRLHRVPLAVQHIELVDLDGLDEQAVLAMMANFEQSEADRHRRQEYENSPPGVSVGEESVEYRVGPREGVATENGELDWPSFSESPEKDTSLGGTRIGGYVARRK